VTGIAIPASCLGAAIDVERVRFSAKVRSPGRRFAIIGMTESWSVTLFEKGTPRPMSLNHPIRRFLRVDPDGGLRLTSVSAKQLPKTGPTPSPN